MRWVMSACQKEHINTYMHTCKGADTGGTDVCGFARLLLVTHLMLGCSV